MKHETILWIFCIVVVSFLFFKVTIESTSYDCDECTVTLMNEVAGGARPYEFGTFKIAELFEEYYEEGHCSILWSPTQGYTNG